MGVALVFALALALALGVCGRKGAAARRPAGPIAQTCVAIPADVDGFIVRGRWRASIAIGVPRLCYTESNADGRAVSISRAATTLTIVRGGALTSGPVPQLRASVPRLRGVAASGAVELTLQDRSVAALFLDLSGSGSVHASGAVPLLRVTTSGSVRADLTALEATTARVHARQHSRLAIRARDALTLVALDSAHVSYAAKRVYPTVRDAAAIARL